MGETKSLYLSAVRVELTPENFELAGVMAHKRNMTRIQWLAFFLEEGSLLSKSINAGLDLLRAEGLSRQQDQN